MARDMLAWLVLYSYPVVGLTVLVAAIGLPLPSTVIVLAAAGIEADGDPNPFVLATIVLMAAVRGDMLSYGLARWGGTLVYRAARPTHRADGRADRPLERRFERWCGVLVVATRCVLTGLALPTNLIAGVGGYPAHHFLGYAILAEGVWTVGLVTLGWWYGSNWVALLGYIDDASSTQSRAVRPKYQSPRRSDSRVVEERRSAL